jgi:hypothetical protein
MSGRKRLSGAEYRKQKTQRERNLQNTIRFPKQIHQTSKEEGGSNKLGCLEGSSNKLTSLSITHITSSSSSDDGGNVPNEEHSEVRVDYITISDPGSWPPKLTDSLRFSIVKQGPTKPDPMYEYFKDAFNRRCTVANMKRRLKNGEEINRPWLLYSAIKMPILLLLQTL